MSYTGLTSKQAKVLHEKYGANEIREHKKESIFIEYLKQFKSPLIYFLLVVSVFTIFLEEYKDTAVILVVVFFNSAIGFFQERKTQHSLEALKSLITPHAKVYRDGKLIDIKARELVCGDIVRLESGDRVPADGVLLEEKGVQVNESQLTGESYPVSKSEHDKVSMSTIVTAGKGVFEVKTIGMDTEIGKISAVVSKYGKQLTPLEKKYKNLTNKIIFYVLAACGVALIVGLIRGISLEEMFRVASSLGVSAIPEGLPVVLSLTLAIGVYRMSKQKALIKNLPSSSTLAAVDVICTDKTGTLTKGKIELKEVDETLNSDKSMRSIELGVLCNDAVVTEDQRIGDLLDIAIIDFSSQNGVNVEKYQSEHERLDDIPFDSSYKYQATLNKFKDKNLLIVKGALEVLVGKCKFNNGKERQNVLELSESMTKKGYRIIALCYKHFERSKLSKTDVSDLTFHSIFVFVDPLRKDIREAIHKCKVSGIDVIMITGDHINTAKNIAEKAEIFDPKTHKALTGEEFRSIDLKHHDLLKNIKVIARATPIDKSKLIDYYKSRKKLVAMTGDGVNDSPALVKADIGISMGENGTDAARDASSMVLLDDKFPTIINGIEEARGIFDNVRKVIAHLLITSFSEILTIIIALILGIPLPLIAVQILFLNLVTDGLIDIALGTEPKEKGIMFRKVRRYRRDMVDRVTFFRVLTVAPIMTLGTLFLFNELMKYHSVEYARTGVLLIMAMYQWFNAINSRSEDRSIFRVGLFKNRLLVFVIIFEIFLCYFAIYNPFMQEFLQTESLDYYVWVFALALTFPMILFDEFRKKVIPIFFTKHV